MNQHEANDTLSRVTVTKDLCDPSGCYFAREATSEDVEVKEGVFPQLVAALTENVTTATNTSSMSTSVLARYTRFRNKVMRMYLHKPPRIVKPAAAVRFHQTDEDTVKVSMDLVSPLGNAPINFRREAPGFIVNRTSSPQTLETIRLAEKDVTTPEEVDKAVLPGLNYPMGPFGSQDLMGKDIALNVPDYITEKFASNRWAVACLRIALLRAGRLAKKLTQAGITIQSRNNRVGTWTH